MSHATVRAARNVLAAWDCNDASTKLVGTGTYGFDLDTVGGTVAYSQTALVADGGTSVLTNNGNWSDASFTTTGNKPSDTYAIEYWHNPTSFRTGATNADKTGLLYDRKETTGSEACMLGTFSADATHAKVKAWWDIGGTAISAVTDDAVLTTTGGPYQIIATFNGTNIVISINGVKVDATQGTEAVDLATESGGLGLGFYPRIGIGSSMFSTYKQPGYHDAIRIYGEVLTSLDAEALYAGSEPVEDTDAGVYNAEAIQPIWSVSRIRRTDKALSGNSNMLRGDNLGHLHGHQQACDTLIAPAYGLGVVPFDSAGDYAYQASGAKPVGPVEVSAELPAWLTALTMAGPQGSVFRNAGWYIADGVQTGTVKEQIQFVKANESLYDPDERMIYHATFANFATGTADANNFKFCYLIDGENATGSSNWYSTVNGTDELVDYEFEIPDGARGESTSFQIFAMQVDDRVVANGDRMTGPIYAGYQQVEFPNRNPGPRINIFSASPGKALIELAQAMNQSPAAAIAEQLRQMVRLQPTRKMLIFQVVHLINDLQNTSPYKDPAWDATAEDFTSDYRCNEPDGFANNMRYIFDRLLEAWATLETAYPGSYATDDLRFIVGAAHPKVGTNTLNGVTKDHVDWLDLFGNVMRNRAWPDTTIIKGDELVTTATMASNGEYVGVDPASDSAHLTATGYANHATREVTALIGELGVPAGQTSRTLLQRVAAMGGLRVELTG